MFLVFIACVSACYLAVFHRLIYALIPLLVLVMPSHDPYGLFHLSLNNRPGEDAEPLTEWLNMGFWKHTKVFPEACHALALKLALAARCRSGGSVLDVGHGTGESLILHLSDPSIPRPARLTGVTSLQSHYERSKARVERILSQADGSSLSTNVTLYYGDAVFRSLATDHPLDPSSNSPPFTSILALDCAYHFHTRRDFLRQAFTRLSSGGRVALADICFSPAALQRRWIALVTAAVMPTANMVSPEKYVQDMQEIGFVDVTMEDVSEDVFPGFIGFLQSRGIGWWIFGGIFRWYISLGVRFVIVAGTRD